jgi:hypothetical protein
MSGDGMKVACDFGVELAISSSILENVNVRGKKTRVSPTSFCSALTSCPKFNQQKVDDE